MYVRASSADQAFELSMGHSAGRVQYTYPTSVIVENVDNLQRGHDQTASLRAFFFRAIEDRNERVYNHDLLHAHGWVNRPLRSRSQQRQQIMMDISPVFLSMGVELG